MISSDHEGCRHPEYEADPDSVHELISSLNPSPATPSILIIIVTPHMPINRIMRSARKVGANSEQKDAECDFD